MISIQTNLNQTVRNGKLDCLPLIDNFPRFSSVTFVLVMRAPRKLENSFLMAVPASQRRIVQVFTRHKKVVFELV